MNTADKSGTKLNSDMSQSNYVPACVWIIGVCADSGRYTPSPCKRNKVALETSYGYFTTYGACLTACQEKNEEEGLV